MSTYCKAVGKYCKAKCKVSAGKGLDRWLDGCFEVYGCACKCKNKEIESRTNNRESRVQGNVGLVSGVSIDLTSASQATERVEHAWAQKAHHGDENKLGRWRGIPWQAEFANLELLVFPADWQSHGVFARIGRVGGRVDLVIGVFLRHIASRERGVGCGCVLELFDLW